ncbi:MAG: hypothetical protein ACLP9K_08905 [Nitrososphaerales archaeon]
MRHRSKLLVVLVLFLAASLAFAHMAYSSPVKYIPAEPLCGNQDDYVVGSAIVSPLADGWSMSVIPLSGGEGGSAAHCNGVYAQYNKMVATDTFPLWLYQSYAEIAEGFAALALLVPLLSVERLDFAWLHRPLVPTFPRPWVIALVLTGTVLFALCVFTASEYWNLVHSAYRSSFLTLHQILSLESSLSVGILGFGAWCMAVLALSFRRDLVTSVRFFGLPAILFLMSMLFAFDYGEMTTKVTAVTSWMVNGIPILSNWFVFIVSAGLMVWLTLTKGGPR